MSNTFSKRQPTQPQLPSNRNARLGFSLESLEARQLMTAVPPAGGGWVPYAQFIQQDVAANNFPFLDGSNQTVALIDRGVDYLMPELGGSAGKYSKVLGGANFRPGDDPNLILDDYGHGTGVAGIIAANPYNLN